MEEQLRLQTFLAHAGAASRRASERLILEGRVAVNGIVITKLGEKVSPSDSVTVDNIPFKIEKNFHYIALNKPPGYICTQADPEGRPLAASLLPPLSERLYNVGRLDFLSSGLIFFTNDGAFAAKAGHPSGGIEKEYVVVSSKKISEECIQSFLNGIEVDGEFLQAKTIKKITPSSLSIILTEGKNREIRRVFASFHLHLVSLKRIRIGSIRLGSLKEGESRALTKTEVESILNPPAAGTRPLL